MGNFKGNAFLCGALIALAITPLATTNATAFGKVVKPYAMSIAERSETALQQIGTDHSVERRPLVLNIGARKHLFDGQFLCDASDQSPRLFSAKKRFYQ